MYQIGLDAKLYYSANSVGDNTVTWVEIVDVEDVTLNIEHDEATVKNRASMWEKVLLGQNMASVEFTITQNVGNAVYDALRDAKIARDDIAIAVASGLMNTNGTEFFMMDAKLTTWAQSEPLVEAKTVAITARPSATGAEPEHGEVGA